MENQRSRVKKNVTVVPINHTVVTDTTNKEIMFGNLPTVVPMSHTVVASFGVGKIQFYLLVFPFSMALMCIYVTFILRL
jgi:hypothetical protein